MNPSRRRFLWTGTGLVSVAMLTACGLPPLPGSRQARVRRIGFLAVGTREGRAFWPSSPLLCVACWNDSAD